MTPPVFALCLMSLLWWAVVAQTTDQKFSSPLHEEITLVSVKNGEDLTLKCFYEGAFGARLYWYKQTLGQKPRIISTFYMYDKKKYFYEGILVSVKGSGLSVPALVQQAESIQPGGSVTLNCTVHTGTCDGEHSVYWFRDAEESHPGLIYTHGGSDDQCERKPNTQTHTCVYNLPLQTLNLSQAGTYYCAVVSCGHILFGDRTKLDFKEEDSLVLVYFLSGAWTLAILSVLLAFLVCMMNKKKHCKSTESQVIPAAPTTTKGEGHQHEENIYYAALSINLHCRSRDRTWSECVYHSVKEYR